MFWLELKQNFTIPAEFEESVKDLTLKKIATQFQTFKMNSTNTYIKGGKIPEFNGELEKLMDY